MNEIKGLRTSDATRARGAKPEGSSRGPCTRFGLEWAALAAHSQSLVKTCLQEKNITSKSTSEVICCLEL